MSARKDKGMTLIELVVAMAIFALVAVMGLQGLAGMLRIRDRLAEVDQGATALSQTIALMRNDLTAVMPMRFFPPDGPSRGALRQDADGTLFALSIAGQPDLAQVRGTGQLHRAIWQVDTSTATLSRQVWRTLTPANITARTPAVDILTGVTDLRVRSYWQGQGWINGATNPLLANAPTQAPSDEDGAGGAPERYSDFIPAALEVTFVTATQGDITLIETLR